MSLFSMPHLRRHERATLGYSYAGEFGRGAFAALGKEFCLLVALSYFAVTSRWLLWMLSSAAFFGLMGGMSATSLTGRWRKKTIVRGLEVTSRLLVMGAAFATQGYAFVFAICVAVALSTASMPLVSGIYGANFSTDVRGRAVGRLQGLAVGTTGLAAAGIGFIMGLDVNYFRAVIVVVALLSLACSLYSWRLPESRYAGGRNGGVGLRDFVSVLSRDHAFVYIEAVWFIAGLSNLWLFPIRVFHLRDQGYGDQQIMFLTTAAMFTAMVLATGLWGRILYRINFAYYRMLTSGIMLAGLLVFFNATHPAVICLGTVLWGLGQAGGSLSWRLMATFFTAPSRVAVYMSVHTFLCGIRGIIGPFLSLHLREQVSTQAVVWISTAGFLVSILMLVPFVPVAARRQAAEANA